MNLFNRVREDLIGAEGFVMGDTFEDDTLLLYEVDVNVREWTEPRPGLGRDETMAEVTYTVHSAVVCYEEDRNVDVTNDLQTYLND